MLFPHVLLAVLFICQGSAHCFHQFPCTFSKMVPHLAMGSTKPSQFLGAAQIHRGGEEHLKGLREVENKIPGSLEARKSPKISSLDAVSCSSPIQGISALCWATVRLPKTEKPKAFLSFLCKVMEFDSEGGGEDSGKRKPENWFYLLQVIQVLFSIKPSTALQRQRAEQRAAVPVTKDAFPGRKLIFKKLQPSGPINIFFLLSCLQL